MRTCALLFAAAVALGFAPAPLPRPPKPPKAESWLGTWDQVGHPRATFEITATHMTYHNASGSHTAYLLSSGPMKSPKTYDIGHQPGTVEFVGIWKVEGDLLTICYRGARSPRPDTFERLAGAQIETFTRKKR